MLELLKKFRVKFHVMVLRYFVKKTQFVEHGSTWQKIELEKYLQIFNPLNAELNLICHLLALLGAHHILHVNRVRVKGHFNPLNAELNPICHLLAFLGAHHILHVSRIRVKNISLCLTI